jgi:4'-phosphopantetheinyl transferase
MAVGKQQKAAIWQPYDGSGLADNQVHVWRVPVALEPSRVSGLWATLTDEECARADAFRVPGARQAFIVARAALRHVLARYLTMSAERITFRRGRFGKPELGTGDGEPRLRFNISHSHELALYAITMEREVGIDVEHLRRIKAPMEIAERLFSASEAMSLRRLTSDLRDQAFFACWTRKEAYVKARGWGLSMPLSQFSVSVAPGHGPLTLRTADCQEATRWSMYSLNVDPGYAAALAIEGGPCQVKLWSWSPA